MNRTIKNMLIWLIIIIYIFIYRFLVCNYFLKYNESITCSFTILLSVLSFILYGYRKNINNYLNKQLFRNVISYIIKYFIIIYGVGVGIGFLKNTYSLKITGLLENLIPLVITIIFTELFRYIFIRANRDKKIHILIISLLLSALEISMFIRYDSFGNLEQIFKFTTLTILPVIMKNIMCSHLTYYNNIKGSLVYRLLIDTYIYFIPILPDFNDYVSSVVNLLLPFLIFISSIRIVEDSNKIARPTIKRVFKFKDAFIIAVLALIACMVFGIGPLQVMGIKTPSMEPAINIGDAVLIDKTYNNDKLKKGDIIAYKDKNDIIVIHRIFDINKDSSFITKGDSNNAVDPDYVTKDKIVGKVILTIPYIAYPSIYLRGE